MRLWISAVIEPVAPMHETLAETCPQATIIGGTAAATTLPDESTDLVLCAQFFHWFATSAALNARILKPLAASSPSPRRKIQHQLFTEIETMLAGNPATRGQEQLTVPYLTDLYICRKIA